MKVAKYLPNVNTYYDGDLRKVTWKGMQSIGTYVFKSKTKKKG